MWGSMLERWYKNHLYVFTSRLKHFGLVGSWHPQLHIQTWRTFMVCNIPAKGPPNPLLNDYRYGDTSSPSQILLLFIGNIPYFLNYLSQHNWLTLTNSHLQTPQTLQESRLVPQLHPWSFPLSRLGQKIHTSNWSQILQ